MTFHSQYVQRLATSAGPCLQDEPPGTKDIDYSNTIASRTNLKCMKHNPLAVAKPGQLTTGISSSEEVARLMTYTLGVYY